MASKNLEKLGNLFYYDWDFTEPPPNHFICTACNNVLKNPRLTSCCRKRFCMWCFKNPENDYDDQQYCHECQKTCEHSIPDKQQWERILDLDVKCPFTHRGCLWTGELRARAAHLTSDCQYVDTDCSYGCAEKLEKYELDEHLKYFCPKRPVTCQYCNEKGEQQFIQEDHKKECPEFPIQCPNNCGKEHLRRKDLKVHLSECPEEVVECNYYYAGCGKRTKRKFMAEHLSNTARDHLNLKTSYFLKELQEKDDLLAKLTVETEQQFLELRSTHVEHLRDIVKSNQEQHDRACQDTERIAHQLELQYNKLELSTNMLVHSRWEIQREDLKISRQLHVSRDRKTEILEGTYNNSLVLVKQLRPRDPKDFFQEAHILMKLEHENIIKLYGVVKADEPVCIVLEQTEYGTLKDYLTANSDSILLHQQIDMCKQVAIGLNYLQQKLCIHRNIKAKAIFLQENFNCKIGDFKLARLLTQYQDECIATEDEGIPVRWSAPEVIQKRIFCLKSDVWSYGVLMYEIATCGCMPYSNQTNLEVLDYIIAGHHMHRPSNCSENFYSLMIECWKQDPWTRPTFEALADLLDHVKDSHDYAMV